VFVSASFLKYGTTVLGGANHVIFRNRSMRLKSVGGQQCARAPRRSHRFPALHYQQMKAHIHLVWKNTRCSFIRWTV